MAINNTLFQKVFDGDLQSQHALCSQMQILLMETTFQANLGKTQEGCLLTEARCWARYNIST